MLESAAIAIPDAVKGNQMIVFCVLKPGYAPGEALRGELGDKIIANLGKSLAARQILFVDDLPKTRNAKLMRRMIRAAYLNQDPGDNSALVNPESLDSIRQPK